MDSAFKRVSEAPLPVLDLLEESVFALYQSINQSAIEVFLIAIFGGKEKFHQLDKKNQSKNNRVQSD